MNISKFVFLCFILLGMFAPRIQAQQTFFEDQFNGSSLDTTTKWSFYGAATDSLGNATGGDGNVGAVTGADINGNGGTNFGFKPTIESDADGTRYARLRLDTHNPRDTTRLKGTEMYSRMGFGPPSNAPRGFVSEVKDKPDEISTGFEFEARFRYLNNPTFPQKGGVGAFWTYWNHGTSGDVKNEFYSSYEIDYEMFYNETYVLGTGVPILEQLNF